MLKKLLSTSSSQALNLGQYQVLIERFYPRTFFVNKIAREKFPDIAAAYPNAHIFGIYNVQGDMVTIHAGTIESAFEYVQDSKDAIPRMMH